MARYKNTQRYKRNGKTYYSTTLHEKVPERNDDLYFISQEGDRLDNLANRFYGDAKLWWFIGKVNNINTMNVPSNISLRIPSKSNMKKFVNI